MIILIFRFYFFNLISAQQNKNIVKLLTTYSHGLVLVLLVWQWHLQLFLVSCFYTILQYESLCNSFCAIWLNFNHQYSELCFWILEEFKQAYKAQISTISRKKNGVLTKNLFERLRYLSQWVYDDERSSVISIQKASCFSSFPELKKNHCLF